MRPPQHTLRASAVQSLAQQWLLPVLGPWPASVRRCTPAVAGVVLAYAAHRLASIPDAGARLAGVPKGGTVRGLLGYLLDDCNALERRPQVALVAHLPRAIRRGRWIAAIDTTPVPYHGLPFRDPAEVYRGRRQGGTAHFHAYATASLVRDGRRFTLAPAAVRHGVTPDDVVGQLLRRVRATGLKIRRALLDRGFNAAGVVRYLQAGRTPFAMPQAVHGAAPADGRLRGPPTRPAGPPTPGSRTAGGG
jgi:hypothetical protein